MWIADWTARAACKETDPDELFVQGAAQNRAKLICRGCVVRTECLADALDNRIEFGVWGGMTERERRALLRRRPDVTSWRELLEHARNAYERTADDSSPARRLAYRRPPCLAGARPSCPPGLVVAEAFAYHSQAGQVVHVLRLGGHPRRPARPDAPR